MLDLKFAIYYRAASLPPQASYAVLAEESHFKHSPHTNSISNSAILRNNYIHFVAKWFVRMRTHEEKMAS